jgi:hypothetical protein
MLDPAITGIDACLKPGVCHRIASRTSLSHSINALVCRRNTAGQTHWQNATWEAGTFAELGQLFTLYWTQMFADGMRAQGTVRVFRQKFTLEDAIGSHACSLETNTRVTNDIPLGSSLLLPVDTVNCVQTLKVRCAFSG